MSIFNFGEVFEHLKGDMAKARARRSSDEKLVAGYVDRLKRARIDRPAFESVFEELKLDDRLKAADVIAIAQQYSGGGKRPSSKAVALAAISKRFVEIVRFHAKNKVAEKARPW